MRWPRRFSLPTAAAVVGALVLLAPIVALGVAWSGAYNIAASRGHPEWLNWFLGFGMRHSVQANADDRPSPPLEDRELIRLGAAHFQGGCAPCHAAPGDLINPIFAGMLPSPPRLEEKAPEWRDHELHWIIRNGLQYAGMPAWSGTGREDEVWAVVAFLRQMPDMTPDTYQSLAGGNSRAADINVTELRQSGVATMARTACDRCHDTEASPPASDLVPRLAGQSMDYLVRALKEYRSDKRQSGFMEPIAAQLTGESITALAAHYSGRPSPGRARLQGITSEHGQRLVEFGDPARDIPACNSCHLAGRPDYPRLAGQSERYIRSQLVLFHDGKRQGSPQARLMTTVAARLNTAEIEAVSAYLGRQNSAPPSEPVGDNR